MAIALFLKEKDKSKWQWRSLLNILLIFFSPRVNREMCLCTFHEIQIGTVRTRREFAGQPLWKVTVTNTCTCRHKHVTPSCETCQVMVLHPQRNTCLLIKKKGFSNRSHRSLHLRRSASHLQAQRFHGPHTFCYNFFP